MNAGRLILTIAAAILIFFGILFVWGAFSEQGNPNWILIGLIGIGVGFGLIWFAGRLKPEPQTEQNVTLNIDLPANVDLDSFKCQSCGGALTTDNVEMVAGAPVVSCPYCGTTYQLTEDPKW